MYVQKMRDEAYMRAATAISDFFDKVLGINK